MPDRRSRRHRLLGGGAILLTLIAAALGPGAAVVSAAAPVINGAWSSSAGPNSTQLNAEINPSGKCTTYYFEYITKVAYEANGGNFTGASRSPLPGTRVINPDTSCATGSSPISVARPLFSLQSDTTYRYRVTARNDDDEVTFPPAPNSYLTFATFPQISLVGDPCANSAIRKAQGIFVLSAGPVLMADCRAWEMVSPIDKNGGQVDPPQALADGGVLQAAAQGSAATYSSAASFAGGAGAPPASQYIATRTGGGWSTQNITVPIFSGSYDTVDGGAPYRLFSGDLARGLLLGGKRCRGEDEAGCPVANPTLPGTGAPAGFQNYYMRTTSGSAFEALLGAGDLAGQVRSDFAVSLAGTSPDLLTSILSTCARLTSGATNGCGGGEENLYKWSGGSISLVNTTPDAELGAQSGAVSTNGSRVYFKDLASGNIYLRNGVAAPVQVDGDAGGGGTFQTASGDGSVAFYTDASDDLWRYETSTGRSTRLTSSGDVEGVLGTSDSASHVYYLTASGLFLRQGATTTAVAEGADASNHSAASGTARVSADGTKLLFISTTPLRDYAGNTYDNTDLRTRAPDSQVYLYDTVGSRLTCVSCNPSHGRPTGPSSIPGATENGSDAFATVAYKPRALSANGARVYFDSDDDLVFADANSNTDVYQWEAKGSGNCARDAGCVTLISSGRAIEGASFVDASADGSDAFFLTGDSLAAGDPGSVDLYVARVGGGYPLPFVPIPCNGDACQVLPPEPVDPTLTTLLPGVGNPANTIWRRYGARSKKCPKGKRVKTIRKRDGRRVKRCVKKTKRKKRGNRRAHRRARR